MREAPCFYNNVFVKYLPFFSHCIVTLLTVRKQKHHLPFFVNITSAKLLPVYLMDSNLFYFNVLLLLHIYLCMCGPAYMCIAGKTDCIEIGKPSHIHWCTQTIFYSNQQPTQMYEIHSTSYIYEKHIIYYHMNTMTKKLTPSFLSCILCVIELCIQHMFLCT